MKFNSLALHAPLSGRRKTAKGVSLIELMVGMLLGLVVVLVVAQVLSFAEGQKRTSTSGSDAQVNGALALYSLQREIQMAGYGLTNDKAGLGCPIHANHSTTGNFVWNLVPALIQDGANGAPDTITVMSASRNFSVPLQVTVDHLAAADRFVVRSAVGVNVGDMLIALPSAYDAASNWCSAFNVSAILNTNQLQHTGGVWNESLATVFPANGYLAGTQLLNTGQLVSRTFSVSADYVLRQQTLGLASGAASTEDLFPQIVNLQAMYGKDTDGDGVVDAYDNGTPTTNAGWRQVLSVRIALVARSVSYQKEEVSLNAPQWDVGSAVNVAGAVDCNGSRCINMKVEGVPDWKHYRYRVYDVVVPLRNMLW
ncbi:pilus assembly protein PilW [Paucibacter sp. KBW04]|uniref:PilW family protein n=1 Tax=Paucibacter sp. KBW04 TaxID=2153361 RepID=UPI000F5840EF|nr:PilW family protein [Paucibacter sp. KBW04]RQO62627.1 pilus assembly protein PilW [Paucibacter sp. KBW04]